jgi:hypothetical protein
MAGKFFLLYDLDRDPVFLDIFSGSISWVLPTRESVKSLCYMAHLSENGQPYYEDLANGSVGWNLPSCLSSAARQSANYIQENYRLAIESIIGKQFVQEISAVQVRVIDEYLSNLDAMKNNIKQEEQRREVEEESDDEIVRDSSAGDFAIARPSRATTIRTLQSVKNSILKVI